MRVSITVGSAVAIICATVVQTLPLNSPIPASVDYIVVGGGASGLTVARRLSERPDVTVLVLEAGPADNYKESIQIPIFVGQDLVSQYNWGITSVPQIYLDGAARWIPQGKGLGGGTIINALLWNRGNADDYNSWVTLGNPGWSWPEMLPYFQRSETFHRPGSQAAADTYGILNDLSLHGYDGPVSVAYPRYFYNASIQFFAGLKELGIPAVEPNEGTRSGAMFLPQSLDHENMTRADARRSYYDPVADRSNLFVSTNQHVTRLLFKDQDCADKSSSASAPPPKPTSSAGTGPSTANGILLGRLPTLGRRKAPAQASEEKSHQEKLRVRGVEFAANTNARRCCVMANREVIVAAGALHTPQILELSGIGNPSAIEPFGIESLIDLPGVGNNLQDHLLAGVWSYFYNSTYTLPADITTDPARMAAARAEYMANKTGPFTSGPPDGCAFPSLVQMTDQDFADALADIADAQDPEEFLDHGLDAAVVAGFAAMKPLLSAALRDPQRHIVEILNNNAGGMTYSNMRPFARGHVHIGSAQPFDPPIVDPRYASNPIDSETLFQSVKFNRRLLNTSAMSVFNAWQVGPTVDATDDAVRAFVKSNSATEYHPSGTAAMLPRELGGVVDPNLLVYGTENLRIVDASIMPLIPAAHLQSVVYAVAEKAAQIIKDASTTAAKTTSTSPAGTRSSIEAVAPKLRSDVENSHVHLDPVAAHISDLSATAHVNKMALYGLPIPRFDEQAVAFPGTYPDAHPYDHPWDQEPNYMPKAIDSSIDQSAFGPPPRAGHSAMSGTAWPQYGVELASIALGRRADCE